MTTASPPPAPTPPAAPSPEAATPRGRALLDALAIDTRAAPGLRRFVILDGARDPGIHVALERHDPERTCLFAGDLPTVLEAAAPWLVDLDAAPPACVAWLVDEVWGTSAGVWLVAEASLGELRKHLRRFLRVKGPGGAKLMFRSYDPRVLRLFLEVATPEQLPFLFGPIAEWSVEDEEPDALLRFNLGQGGLTRARVSLTAPPPAPSTPAPAAPAPPPPSVDVSGPPEVVAVRLRAALGERPGAPRLVAAAADVARGLDPTERARADALRAALEAQRAALTPTAVGAALRASKPAPDRSWERPFLALLPGAQGWLTAAERTRLRASCAAVREAGEAVARAELLRQEARDLPEGVPGEEAAGKILEELRQHHLKAQAWAEASDPQLEPVVSHLKRLMTRLELRKTVDGRAVGTGLASLLMSLKAHGTGGDREVDRVRAEALEAALGSTTGSDAPAEGVERPAAPASVRKGRVPPRHAPAVPLPLDLPGRERESFVVTHAQLAALAAAGDRALQAALERHAVQHHAERAAVLAEDLPAFAARCRAKAARYRIQRRASVLRLFDLMLEHDPEFEGLARFDWAAALLESELLDPDSKPDMIHARVQAQRDEEAAP